MGGMKGKVISVVGVLGILAASITYGVTEKAKRTSDMKEVTTFNAIESKENEVTANIVNTEVNLVAGVNPLLIDHECCANDSQTGELVLIPENE